MTALPTNQEIARPLPWFVIWLMSVTRPTLAHYQTVARQADGRALEAWTWLLSSGVAAGIVVSIAPWLARPARPVDGALGLAIGGFSVMVVVSWAIFAGCTHAIARLLQGRGRYGALLRASAAFHAPLLLLASVLALLPGSRLVVAALYLYWLALYVIAIRSVHGISRPRALIAVLLSLVVLTAAALGVSGLVIWSL